MTMLSGLANIHCIIGT